MPKGVPLPHVGWLFNPSTPTATHTFTLDQEVTVAADGKSYSGRFKFKMAVIASFAEISFGFDNEPIPNHAGRSGLKRRQSPINSGICDRTMCYC
jgi:hypothetical protein